MRFLFKNKLTGQTYPDDLFFIRDESDNGSLSFYDTMKRIDDNFDIFLCNKLDLE